MERSAAYRLLGVDATADRAGIRAAFRRAVMNRHPDTSREPDVSAVRDLIEAYRLLVDPAPGGIPDRAPGGSSSTTARRVIVRRGGPDQTGVGRCRICDGTGLEAVWRTCPSCAGSGVIPVIGLGAVGRLRVCHRCRGRACSWVEGECTHCGGSGRSGAR